MIACDDIQARFVLGEDLSEAEERRLAVTFGVQPGFSEQFLRDEQFAGMLTMMGRCEREDDDFVAATLNTWDEASSPEITRSQSPELPTRPVVAIINDSNSAYRTTAYRKRTRMPLIVLSVASAVLILGGLLLSTQFIGQEPENESWRKNISSSGPVDLGKLPAKSSTEPPSRKIPENQPPRIVARLTATRNCRWKSGIEPAAALRADSLDLLSGVATITFSNGAVVQLAGPCRFELQSPSRGVLYQGRLTASVPKPAIGFTIETPIAVIVDLGTEFRVSVELDGATQVDVLKGAVEYRDRDAVGSNAERKRISAGESYRVRPVKSGSDSSEARSQPKKNNAGGIRLGTIIINGKTYSFSSQEEYEQLMKKLGRSPHGKP